MNKVIVYNYDYGHGGIADFIKYFFHAIHVAEINNAELKLYITHPIKKYIKLKKDYDINLDEFIYLENLPISGKFSDIINFYQKIVLVSRNFYCNRFDFNLKYDLDFKTVNSISYNIFDYMDFTDDIYIILETIKPKENYIAIHARLGDKYLEIKPSKETDLIPYCRYDDRYINNCNYENIIEEIIKNNSDKKIYLFSDNNNFKQELKNKFNTLNIFNNKIINISCLYEMDDYDECIKNVIIEFLFLIKSYELHSLTYAGYSLISSLIGKNKFYKYW